MFDWKKRTRAEQAHVIEEVLDETSALQQAIADSIKKQETYMQQLHMQEASEQQGENPDALLQSI